MALTKPKFQRLETAKVLDKVLLSRVAWTLGIKQEEIRNWNLLIPALESQLLRESHMGARKAVRRHIRKETAISLLGGMKKLEQWLGEEVDYPGDWLSEYHSLLIEYATKGAIKGLSIKTEENSTNRISL